MPTPTSSSAATRRGQIDPVRKWRLEQLVRAGYPEREAFLLSGLRDVDLHLAVRIRERGCPVATALRILL
jgi:hypothetical protein